jgi:hypothetical protein
MNCDFPWDEIEAVWKEMIFALQSFRSDHGHCAVPQIYLPYPSLALWVLQMRQQYKRRKRGEETISYQQTTMINETVKKTLYRYYSLIIFNKTYYT